MRASKKVMGAVLLTSSAALVLGAPTVHADSSADNNNGLLGGLNLLNGVQLNVPVTVGGAGVLGVGTAETAVKSENKAAPSSSSSNSGGGGSSSANGNSGLIGGLNLLNNLQVSLPVTVCGLAVLGDADAQCEVTATNNGGGGGGDVAGESRDQGSSVRGATLPHTGAAGLALIPFGIALVAGGVALRRRVGSES